MRTPGELLAEGECDEMALGQLAVLDELRSRLMITTFPDDVAAEIREIIDRYANEIYDDEDGEPFDVEGGLQELNEWIDKQEKRD